MTLEDATKACRNGAIAAFISAGATLALVIFAMASNAAGELSLWNDPLNFVDILLVFGCGLGMLRRSRTAAVTVFVYFVLARIGIALETGNVRGILTSLIFLYFYGKAIQGAFVYHKLKKAEDPDYRAASKLAYYIGIPVLVLFFALAGFGLLTETDVVPSTEVLAGADVTGDDRALLIENGVLYHEEEIEYFYSYGLTSILEGGSILTNRSVIMYYLDDSDELQVFELLFPDIVSIDLIEPGDFFSDSVYRVTGREENQWLNIALSTEADGDGNFIRALRRKMAMAARDPVVE